MKIIMTSFYLFERLFSLEDLCFLFKNRKTIYFISFSPALGFWKGLIDVRSTASAAESFADDAVVPFAGCVLLAISAADDILVAFFLDAAECAVLAVDCSEVTKADAEPELGHAVDTAAAAVEVEVRGIVVVVVVEHDTVEVAAFVVGFHGEFHSDELAADNDLVPV